MFSTYSYNYKPRMQDFLVLVYSVHKVIVTNGECRTLPDLICAVDKRSVIFSLVLVLLNVYDSLNLTTVLTLSILVSHQ